MLTHFLQDGNGRSCRSRLIIIAVSALALFLCSTSDSKAADFEKSVATLLASRCVGCHNATEPKGGLDLSQAAGILKGGDSGNVIEPGKPEDSFLIERVAEGSMPPGKDSQLSKDEVAVLTAWVRDGAEWPRDRVLSPFDRTTSERAGLDWWSLQPIREPEIPEVSSPRVRNPIDNFVLRRLEDAGFQQAEEADRLTLLRRATFDLIGLPPTLDEINAFLSDNDSDAYERLLDRLLASPHYGERWGRHWLDVARFGESDGFENDKLRHDSWHYRDYVIRSFNIDKPYNLFVKEQLAGDVLEPKTHEGLLATGFLVAGPWDEVQNVGKSKIEKMRTHEEQLEELIGAVSQTFLGLTVNCARCHDHKFDPIPQSDYYRLKAVFDGVDHGRQPAITSEERAARDKIVEPIQKEITRLKLEMSEIDIKLDAAASPSVKLDQLVEGRFGEALDPRRQTIDVKLHAGFHTPPLTVECWARLDSKKAFNVILANQLKESAEHWELYSYSGSGVFSVFLPGYIPSDIRTDIDITDGEWHYLAMTLDGKRVRLFVDGILAREEKVEKSKSGGPPGMLSFGGYRAQKIGCDGIIDDVRISRIIRTPDKLPEKILDVDEDTIGLWRFNRDDGPTLRNAVPAKETVELTEQVRSDLEARKAELLAAFKKQEAELAKHPIPTAYVGVRRMPPPTEVYLRGDIKSPGPEVTAGGLFPVKTLPTEWGMTASTPEGERRLRFAEWVADPRNPLTARVLVNRVWQYHFGAGLVSTPSDMGFNGGQPSHPELLDWLARDFIDQGWSLKQLHKRIMLSATYRQASTFNEKAAETDTDNRLLWRFTPQRLEAETVRDAMLAVSGDLNKQVYGPSFRPFTVTVFLTHFYNLIDPGTPEYNRRTIYRMNINTGKDPFLDALDCPSPLITMPRRRTTTTTLQALSLMNDSFVIRQARKLAERIAKEAGNAPDAQVSHAYRLSLGRQPTPEESAAASDLVSEHGLDQLCWVLLNSSEFLYFR